MVIPAIKVEALEASDPTFEAGVTRTATALMTNPTGAQFTYAAELYLGVTKASSSGDLVFTIPAGGSMSVNFPIVMPLTVGVYEVYLDVKQANALLAHFRATENVTIEISPVIIVGPITWA